MNCNDVRNHSSSTDSTLVPTVPRTLVLTERYLPEIGGSFVWFANVYRRYPPGSVCILTRSYPGAEGVDANFPGIETIRLKLERYSWLRPESLMVLLKLVSRGLWTIRRHAVEIVHAGKLLPEGFVARLLWKATGVPYVVYAHGEEIALLGDNPEYARHYPTLRAVYRDAAAVIANSDFTTERLTHFGANPSKIVRISPGVDCSLFSPAEKDPVLVERLGLADKLVLLTVGRLQRRKGHDNVLRALRQVLQQVPNLVYLIVSDGEERLALEQLAKELNVDQAVRFVGEVPGPDLSRYYNTCDIFILANRTLSNGEFEGFGIVFLEASACGKPVIAGNSGGTADPVRHGWNGLRVDASQPMEIAEAIVGLAKDPARRAVMGSLGRELAESEYEWEQVTERILALSRDVVGARARAGYKEPAVA
jgi:phosphatidyl-myo-inositol dimannoside synthase